MYKIINQFRRLYDDRGLNDHDFTDQESKLRMAQEKMKSATDYLMKSSERLSNSALKAMSKIH